MMNVKGFLGFIQSSELKMHLRKARNIEEANFVQTEHGGISYIGYPMDFPLNSQELKQMAEKLKSQLQQYCPKINIEKQKIVLFPQIYIG